MSLYKEIKYSINSTVGTSGFKPLSEMICPGNTEITFSRSYNSIYYNFGNGPVSTKLISFGAGSIAIFVIRKDTSSADLKVYKNGVLYGNVTSSQDVPYGYARTESNMNSISIGDEIEIIYPGDGEVMIGATVKRKERFIEIEQ